MGLAVVGGIRVVGCAQVVQVDHGQTAVGGAVQIVVVILAGLGEGGGLCRETVIHEGIVPGQVTLGRDVVRLGEIVPVVRIEVDGTKTIFLLIVGVLDQVVDAGAQAEVVRQAGINVSGSHMVLGLVGIGVLLHHRIRVVVVVRSKVGVSGQISGGIVVEVLGTDDVPGTPSAVRTLPILEIFQIDIRMAPLNEVADVVTIGGVTFLLSVLVHTDAIAIAQVGGQPAVGLDLRTDAEGTTDSLGIVEDTGTVHVGEGHAGVHSLDGLVEGNGGRVSPSDAGKVAEIELIAPRFSLAVLRMGRIPGNGGTDHGRVVITGTPVHIFPIVIGISAVRQIKTVQFESGLRIQDIRIFVKQAGILDGIVHGRILLSHRTATEFILELDVVVQDFSRSRVAELHEGLTFLSLLGGDDDSTVGTAGTVQGGRGGALQDVDALHVIHIDGRSAGDGSVDHIDRLATFLVVVGGRTTEDDLTLAEGGTGRSPELRAGNLTGEGVTEGGAVDDGQLLVVDDLGGIADGFLLAGQALGRDDDLVEVLRIRLESDVDDGHAVHLDGLRLVAHVADDKDAISRSIDGESTLHISQRVGSGTSLHDDGSARDGFTVGGVGNRAFDGDVLCVQRRRGDGKQARQEQFYFFHKQETLVKHKYGDTK